MTPTNRSIFLRVLSVLLLPLFCFTACAEPNKPPSEPVLNEITSQPDSTASVTENGTSQTVEPKASEFRAVWVSYTEISDLFTADEVSFYNLLYQRFLSLHDWGFNTVIFHARAFGDAFYASEYFPWSSYLTGEQGVSPGYDPLSTAIRAAHDAGLQLHAWINPYRVSYQTDIQSLYATNPARLMAENGQQMDLLQTESGIYYNPASLAAQQLILNGIREILERYDVDGIHIDDYFYPDDVGDSDAPSYMEYTKGGGTLSLNEWRTANVSALVSGIYSAVKAIDPQILFGISPSGMIDKNKTTYYADVATWGSVKGYCDYMLPQIYFGFAHEEYPFVELLDQWSDLCSLDSVKLYIGLALYKTGGTDVYAGGESAQNEWIDNTNLITRQVQALRQNKRCSGFALFSFGDLFSNDTHKQQEIQRLLQALDGEG